jgi:hypothetical protein
MVAPDFKFVQPAPATEECMKQIDWMVKTAAMMRGLPAESVSVETKAQSGTAKTVDNWELMELRKDDMEWLRRFEKQLFDVSRVVWNFHNPGKKISESAQFGIDFEIPEAPVAEKDDIAVKQEKMKLGLWTPVDDVIDEAEGIDEDTAKALIVKNIETLRELGLKQEQPTALADDQAGLGTGGANVDRNGRPRQRNDQGMSGRDQAGDVVQRGGE